MKTKHIFLFFVFLILPTQVLAQTSPEGECSATFTNSLENSRLPTNYTASGHCAYPDGTKSASSLTCFEINCCERYLTGTHTKAGVQYKSWRYINQLNCIDTSGKSKTYSNGKDADIPTSIKIDAEKVSIAKTEGDYSPAFAGDDNSFEQTINTDSEKKWYEKPLGLVAIGLIVLIGGTFIVRKLGWNNPTKTK